MKKNLINLLLLATLSGFTLAACQTENPEIKDDSNQNLLATEQIEAKELAQTHKKIEFQAPQATHENMQQALNNLRILVESPHATKASSCKIIAVGHRPCGGPERYLIYSTEKTDEAALLEQVEQYNELSKKFNQNEELYSTCEVIPKPNATLINGFCVPVKAQLM